MSCAGTICTGTHGTGKNYGIVATFVSVFFPIILSNPFAPENFAEKQFFKVHQAIFLSLPGYKEPRLATKMFTGHTLCGFD